jgi:pimeloyl-ACP methyl ester carboxylesterase
MFIQNQDAQIYTVAFGSSPRALMALGGWAGSWEVWTETFTYLSESWRAIAFDHRGTGATLAPVESISLQTMVNDVFVVLDALAVEQCVLAAESAGGMVAILAALQQPERFSGLVLVDAPYYRPMPEGQDPFVTNLKRDFAATIGWFVDTCVPEPDSDAIRHWGRQILGRASQAAAIQLWESTLGMDLRSQVGQISQPTLILQGDADAFVTVKEAEWLAANIPNNHFHILKGAGHVPTVTRPREVADAVNQFFST